MQRTTAPGATSDQRFTDGDSSQGIPASVVDATWLNDVQEEVAGAIEGYNVGLDASKPNQLLGVLKSISGAITTAKNQVTQAFKDADSQLSSALSRKISDEAGDRSRGDSALSRDIAGEADNRRGADNGLGNRIDSEINNRQNADNGLGSRINTERDKRYSDDQSLDNRIDSVINNRIPDAILAAKKDLFPVGSIYCNYQNGSNPSSLLGFGSWSRITEGFLYAQGAAGSGGHGNTGGEREHRLSYNEMPSHAHNIPVGNNNNIGTAAVMGADESKLGTVYSGTSFEGGSGAHNNMPPFVTVYIWRRTG